jgi:hypothetical protein
VTLLSAQITSASVPGPAAAARAPTVVAAVAISVATPQVIPLSVLSLYATPTPAGPT